MWQVAAEHIKSNPIERRIEQHGQQHTVYLHAPCPFPDNLSVMFGEWLYLLRSALDGLMYELVVHDTQLDPPRNARRIYYPINATADNFAQKANTGPAGEDAPCDRSHAALPLDGRAHRQRTLVDP